MLINSVVLGGNSGKKYAEGTGRISTSKKGFSTTSNSTIQHFYAEVKQDLGFTPSLVTVVVTTYNYGSVTCYSNDSEGWLAGSPKAQINADKTYYQLGGSAYVNDSGFLLPVVNSSIKETTSVSFKWKAYE